MRPIEQLRAMFARMREKGRDVKEKSKPYVKGAAAGAGAAAGGFAIHHFINAYGHHVSRQFHDARRTAHQAARETGRRLVNFAQDSANRARKNAIAVKDVGKTSLRTLSFGTLGSVDQAVASAANFGATALEHIIRQRVLRASENIQHQSAKLVGLAQQHFTDASLGRLQKYRERGARLVGGSLTDQEKAIVAEIRHKIAEQNRNLHIQRELRKLSDPNLRAAVTSALEQMKMRGRELHASMGLLDPDVVETTIRRFGLVKDQTPELKKLVELKAKGISTS